VSHLERRRATRTTITGFVIVTVQSGSSKGACYSGTLRDMSDNGVCVLLDGECGLTRGTKVELAFVDAPSLGAWVCHNTRAGETCWSLGMSFSPVPVETPEQHVNAGTDRSVHPEPACGHGAADSDAQEGSCYVRHLVVDDSLSLKVWQEADAEEAFAIVEDSRSDLEQWVEWATQVHTADDLRGFIHYSLQQYRRGKTWQFAIRQHGTIVGGVGLIARSEKVGEIGYWLGSAYQGQGIVTRCAWEVIRFGFETLGFQSIEIRCAITNERSRAVARRLGFIFDGIVPRRHWTGRGLDALMIYRVDRSEAASRDQIATPPVCVTRNPLVGNNSSR
jgi:ribosomal-protein-serine acetyltransferase